jgi:hypothetical protein
MLPSRHGKVSKNMKRAMRILKKSYGYFRSVVMVQKIYRARLGRRSVTQLRKKRRETEQQSSVTLQCALRSSRARATSTARRQGRQIEIEFGDEIWQGSKEASIKIQCLCRQRLAVQQTEERRQAGSTGSLQGVRDETQRSEGAMSYAVSRVVVRDEDEARKEMKKAPVRHRELDDEPMQREAVPPSECVTPAYENELGSESLGTDQQLVYRFLQRIIAETAGQAGMEEKRELEAVNVESLSGRVKGLGDNGHEPRDESEEAALAEVVVQAEQTSKVAEQAKQALLSLAVPYVSVSTSSPTSQFGRCQQEPTRQTQPKLVAERPQKVQFKPAPRPPKLSPQPPKPMPEVAQQLMEELMQKLTRQPAQAGPLMNKLIRLLQQNSNQRLPPNLQQLLQMLLLSRIHYQKKKEYEHDQKQRGHDQFTTRGDHAAQSRSNLPPISSVKSQDPVHRKELLNELQRGGGGENRPLKPDDNSHIQPIPTRANVPKSHWPHRHSQRLQRPHRTIGPSTQRARRTVRHMGGTKDERMSGTRHHHTTRTKPEQSEKIEYVFKSAGASTVGPQVPKTRRHQARLRPPNKHRSLRPLASEEAANTGTGHVLKPLACNLSPNTRTRALGAIPVLLHGGEQLSVRWGDGDQTSDIAGKDPLFAGARELQALRLRPEPVS